MKCSDAMLELFGVWTGLTVVVAAAGTVRDSATLAAAEATSLLARALPAAPDGYSPRRVPCPQDGGRIRLANEVAPDEQKWLKKRRAATVAPMKDLMGRLKIDGFDAKAYIDKVSKDVKNLPNIGIAFSGGGYRALLTGAGAMAAFDSRTPGSKDEGHLGGLLQSTTYVSGLSGGAWMVGSVYSNNFSSIPEMQAMGGSSGSSVWDFDRSMIEGPKSNRTIAFVGVVDYWRQLYNSIQAKRDAMFDVSVTDFWSRGLSHQLINTPDGGASYTWSSIAEQPDFPDGQIPMPIIVADERSPGQIIVPRNATVFEFTPFEMGSWDPKLFGMAPLKYVGSDFQGGNVQGGKCFAGLDNAAFVMGTSSSLFNTAAIGLLTASKMDGLFSFLKEAFEKLAIKLSGHDNDIASWSPNPFQGWRPETNGDANAKKLSLVDGGMDFQNIPLYPHIQPVRAVDVIFAVDSSGDTGNGAGWPNGTALVATYQRSEDAKIQNGTAFPAIPDVNTFVNLGLNAKPSFFGCNSKNMSGPHPLIVYMPNHPYTYWSNITTFTSSLSTEKRNGMIQNGYNMATMGNGSVEAEWPTCVACAVLSRSLERTSTAVPAKCQECFKKHCWNGTLDSKPAKFQPNMVKPEQEVSSKSGKKKGDAGRVIPSLTAIGGAMIFAAALWVL